MSAIIYAAVLEPVSQSQGVLQTFLDICTEHHVSISIRQQRVVGRREEKVY